MTATRFSNTARFWRSSLLPSGDMLTAECYDQDFAPHWRNAYPIAALAALGVCVMTRKPLWTIVLALAVFFFWQLVVVGA